MENFLFPNEIVLKILGYLGLGDLIQCAKVSKRFNKICKDKSLSYRTFILVMKGLIVKCQKSINKVLIARPDIKKVTIGSISREGWIETRLSKLPWKSTGLYRKAEILQLLGASSLLLHFNISKQTLELDVFYFMPSNYYMHAALLKSEYNCR